MGKHRVILRMAAAGAPEGPADFLDKFAAAYKMTPDQARSYIQRARGVLYNTDDLAAAQKGKAYIERLGGIADLASEPAVPAAARATLPAPDSASAGFITPGRGEPRPEKPGAPSVVWTTPAAAAPGAANFGGDDWTVPGTCRDPGVPEFDGRSQPASPASGLDAGLPPDFDETGAVSAAAPAPDASTRPCPKCATLVPAGEDQCPACHVFISKYEKMLARRAQQMGTAGPFGSPAPTAPGSVPITGPIPGPAAFSGPAPGYVPIERDPVKAAAAAGVQIKCAEASYALMYSLVGLGCLGLLGPVAVIYGLKAMNILNNDPRFTGREQAIAGAIIGLLETVLFGILLFVAVRMAQHGFFQGIGLE